MDVQADLAFGRQPAACAGAELIAALDADVGDLAAKCLGFFFNKKVSFGSTTHCRIDKTAELARQAVAFPLAWMPLSQLISVLFF